MPDALDATSTISPERHIAADALTDALNDPSAAWPDVVLRDHQIEALDQLSGRLANGTMRTWVDAPTGSGKTIMFSALAAAVGITNFLLVRRLARQLDAAAAQADAAAANQRELLDAMQAAVVVWDPDDLLVVANGGIRTEADSRVEMNLDTMEASLVLMRRDGGLLSKEQLPEQMNSVRHLAVARDGTIVSGQQYMGAVLAVALGQRLADAARGPGHQREFGCH